ncbi:MAG: glycosyltransferase family A protein [Candidatus Omnitrophica bacterium]|nr:glycosyltransferase family A protein [Candidatus Omnitrophota bacterium]MDD5671512.1 glycosyltransferase family A protein [Candidatus Omnitrophota bacterium]
MPKVSIIIPTRDRTTYLKRAIKSVLAQTYRNYEIIVVQNGPVEHSKQLVQKMIRHGAPMRYVHKLKADPVNARNTGIRASKSDYIAFLDDDDEWLPTKLEIQIHALMKNARLGLIACSSIVLNQHHQNRNARGHFQGRISLKILLTKGCIIPSLSNILTRKTCLDRIGYFDARFPIANDYDLYLRMAQHYALWMTSDPLVRSHQHKSNMTKKASQVFTETTGVLKKLRLSNTKLKGVSGPFLKSIIDKRQPLWSIIATASKGWPKT